ncbi:hypothetical protein INR49_018266 [Caranx melampygus]|nr:hypothetical protein INR49_018266 [Caranx melampygus]
MTPRFLAVGLEFRVMPSRVAIRENVSLRCSGPNTVTSVLSEFSNRKLEDIQDLMCMYYTSTNDNDNIDSSSSNIICT